MPTATTTDNGSALLLMLHTAAATAALIKVGRAAHKCTANTAAASIVSSVVSAAVFGTQQRARGA
jgi:hypothetical protein